MNAEQRNYPFVGPIDLLRFDRVSFLTRMRLGLAALWLRRTSDWQRYEGMRASDWISSRVGREGYERVWGPLLRAKFGPYADDISMTWFWGKIYLRFASREGGLFAREQLGYLSGSFGRLVDAVSEAIVEQGGSVASGVPVQRICTEDGRVTGVQVPSDAGSDLVEADSVIATVPSGIFARMLPELGDLDPTYASMIAAQQYQWASVLVLALDRPLSEHYWLTMTDEDCPFVVAVEQTNFVPGLEVWRQARPLPVELHGSRRPDHRPRRRRRLRAVRAVPTADQRGLRPLVGYRPLAVRGSRRAAGGTPPLSRVDRAPSDAGPRALPGEHHADLSGGPRPELLDPDGPSRRPPRTPRSRPPRGVTAGRAEWRSRVRGFLNARVPLPIVSVAREIAHERPPRRRRVSRS